jgi:hypothetical protein
MTMRRVWRVDAAQVLRRSTSSTPIAAGLGGQTSMIGAFRGDAVEVTGEGFQLYDALVARVNNRQNYPRQDGSPFWEYRPFSEVRDSLPSYELRPLTDRHPAKNVDGKTARFVARGAFGPASFYEDDAENLEVAHVAARLAVWDSELAAKFDAATAAGKPMQLSMGYSLDLDVTPGVTPWGEHYDAIQRNPRINHGAAVPLGRAGTAQVLLDAAGWDLGTAKSLADCSGNCSGVVYVDLGWARRDEASIKIQALGHTTKPKKDTAPMKVTIKIDGVDVELELAEGATLQDAADAAAAAKDAGFADFIKKKKKTEEAEKDKKAKKDAADLATMEQRNDAHAMARAVIGLNYARKDTVLEMRLDIIEAVDGADVRKEIEALDAADQPGAAALAARRAAKKHDRRDERALGLLEQIHARAGKRTDAQQAEAEAYQQAQQTAADNAAMTPSERRAAQRSA